MARQTRLMTSLVALAAAGALLAACDRQQAAGVPPIDSMEASMGLDAGLPPPMAYGPAADALDRGQPVRVIARGAAPERYRYIDDAYQMVDAFGDSPPDYAFDYGGVEPWVWRSQGGYYRVVEAIPDGYREYYYGPQGDAPFLVRDPRYSYAYDRGALVAVYDAYGRVQPASFATRQADYAGRYYARARTLHDAALRQERRRPYADQWRERQQALAAPHQRWAQERDRDAEWRRLREQRPEVERAGWVQERRQREAPRLAEQPRKPDRPMFQARQERAEARRSEQFAEPQRQAQRAEAAQQHAAQASAREAIRAEAQQRQGERRQGEAGQAQVQAERRQAQQQFQAQQQRGHDRQAQHAQAQQSQGEERVRAEPRQERPQRIEAPNAQAHGRPAMAQQHDGGPAQHGGPKGGDKHDRR